uniref:Late embryogenesis abundant protein LEA-2 subgroup domain-containing protein n=1 Tax=Oryza brachyantha TaxID=4533 RepID=J3N4M7_ORYBR
MAGRSRGIGDTGHATRVAVVRCIVVAIIATIVLAGLVALVFWLVVRPKPIEYIITRAVARAVARSTPVPDQAARELEHDLAAGELVSVEVRVVADVRFIVSGVISRYYRVRGTCSPVNIGLSPSAARSFESVPCDVEIW